MGFRQSTQGRPAMGGPPLQTLLIQEVHMTGFDFSPLLRSAIGFEHIAVDRDLTLAEIECRIDATLDPPAAAPDELVAKAERDCFVGASLAIKPRYEWRLG
jgi:hypothetical protein